MGVFNDRDGRDWHVDVTVSALRRVRDSGLGIDLLDVTDPTKDTVQRLLDDTVLLVGVLYEVCRPEVERRGLTAVQFGEALSDGAVIDAAIMALLEPLANFIPSHRGRAMAVEMVRALKTADNLGLNEVADMALAKLGEKFSAAPESLDATQAG